MAPKKPLKSPISMKKSSDILRKIGGALKEIAVAATNHPAIAGLAIMAGCTIVQAPLVLIDKAENKRGTPPDQNVAKEILNRFDGLYNGAQGITMAAMAIPVVMKGLDVATSVISAKKAPST